MPLKNALTFKLGMCNSDRLLGPDSDDRSWKWWSWGKKFWLVKAALWAAHWVWIILQASVQSIDVRRERSLALKSCMMSGLATYISDSSNIKCVGILTFIYMLNALHITNSFMLKFNARYWLIWDGHISFRCFFFKNPKIKYIFHHICSTVCILQLQLFLYGFENTQVILGITW